MSWSVMAARTRIWRTMVAIIRGGNLGGAAWQRAQFDRNRFSPSRRLGSSCAARAAEAELAPASLGASLPPVLAPAARLNNMALARRKKGRINFILIARPLAAT